MANSVIDVGTVRDAIDKVYSILGSLQSQLADPTSTDSRKHSRDALNRSSSTAVDIRQYKEKCSELDAMSRKYSEKCQEYERLLSKYNSTQRLQHKDKHCSEQERGHALLQSAPPKGLPRSYFSGPEPNSSSAASEPKRPSTHLLTSPVHREIASPRRKTDAEDSPTKRARPESAIDQAHGLLLPSSPPALRPVLHYSQRGWRRAPHQKQKPAQKPPPPVLGSSQETHLDFSDIVLPLDNAVEYCSDSDDENTGKNGDAEPLPLDSALYQPEQELSRATRPAMHSRDVNLGEKQKQKQQYQTDLERILDCVGDCKECRAFYSVPGLVLPQQGFDSLCLHNKQSSKSAGKQKEPLQSRMQSQSHPSSIARRGEPSPSLREKINCTAQPKAERPTTPEHFWDIDYFPPIRTAGPEMLRKSRQQQQQQQK